MNHNNSKHMLWMMLACIVPLLIIFLLPVFGIRGNFTWIAIIAMFAMHILMMGGHGHKEESSTPKKHNHHR